MKIVDVEFCPLCGSNEAMFFSKSGKKFKGKGEPFIEVSYYLCIKCGLYFQKPRWEVEYDAEYRQEIVDKGISRADTTINEGLRSLQVADFIGGLYPRVQSLLDVGTSLGYLPELCKLRFGCEVMGVEPTSDHRVQAIARGVPTVPTLQDLPKKDFDLITCIHVLEHVADPHLFLDGFPMREDGKQIVVVEVPNAYMGESRAWQQPWHITGWSVTTLTRLFLERKWIGPVAVNIHGWPGRPHGAIQAAFWR